jgi:hypothetical protein
MSRFMISSLGNSPVSGGLGFSPSSLSPNGAAQAVGMGMCRPAGAVNIWDLIPRAYARG